jgi:hypothetical protein
VASDLTVLEAVAELRAAGFDADFNVVSDPEPGVSCGCGARMPATELEVLKVFRIEGESDPADEVIVAGVRCATCGAKGVLVASYGPMADPADSDVVAALSRRRD